MFVQVLIQAGNIAEEARLTSISRLDPSGPGLGSHVLRLKHTAIENKHMGTHWLFSSHIKHHPFPWALISSDLFPMNTTVTVDTGSKLSQNHKVLSGWCLYVLPFYFI